MNSKNKLKLFIKIVFLDSSITKDFIIKECCKTCIFYRVQKIEFFNDLFFNNFNKKIFISLLFNKFVDDMEYILIDNDINSLIDLAKKKLLNIFFKENINYFLSILKKIIIKEIGSNLLYIDSKKNINIRQIRHIVLNN